MLFIITWIDLKVAGSFQVPSAIPRLVFATETNRKARRRGSRRAKYLRKLGRNFAGLQLRGGFNR